MFTEKNFKNALEVMSFEKISDGIYQKNFSENIFMKADFHSKKLFYPKNLKIYRDNLKNFLQNENFVVFECVHRLLQKGYQPDDIEIEKSWNLGHTQKSGRADICISKNKKIFLIIECKTFGAEFNHELENLNFDGGQLFSYWQQENSCQWLVLYASDFVGEKIIFNSKSVSCNEENYKNAPTVQEKFKIWSEIFQKKLADDVIFHEDTVAYKIGVKPFRKKDLKEFDDTKIINLYEEILRHNSVTNKQNAFDALLELFICKLADESQKNFSDEVDFQFKFGADTFEIFIDRLQKLYHEGMEKFMRIETTYTPLSIVENLLEQNQGKNRKNLENLFKKEFNKLKFYTPNIFNFIKVLNPEIFYMNAKIVREVVELFKNYQIIGAKNLQTLGDMFEQLLDKGFKQDEGQFFTPLPITKFIWNCLPLEKIISAEKNFSPPKIIDYACGAGHFLTQGFETINNFAKNLPKGWEDEKIFGIEKNDRLSTVSKISFFMHGADKGKIKFGDGLENYPDEGISAESFDILVSNPPYSVKNFKKFLQIENKFDTLEKISKDGNEIETLFVERISQLLKPGGIAAVILPSSILNKDGKSFVCAREKILQNFYVRAIAEFGSKTFSATGTKTNILFLEKISPSEKFKIFEDTANIIFENNFSDEWNDEKIFSAWIFKNKIEKKIYQKFIARENDFFDWKNDAYFGEYFTKFVDMTRSAKDFLEKYGEIIFALIKLDKNNFCTDFIPELENLNRKFYDFAHSVEKEKIQYFAQTFTQTTLIISAPDDSNKKDSTEEKKFLGYEWSDSKGREGIKILNPGGLLYDPQNIRSENKLAAAVRNIFYDKKIDIPELEKYFYYVTLSDIIEFSSANFKKIITPSRFTDDDFKNGRLFPTKKLENLVDINLETFDPTKTPDKKFFYVDIGAIDSNKINFSNEILGKDAPSRARRIAHDGNILISTVRPYLKSFAIVKNSPENTLYSTGLAILSSKDEKIFLNEFIFCLFMNDPILMEQMKKKMPKGSYPSINQNDIKNFYVLLPSVEEQKKIVSEFKLIDEKISAQEKIISDGDLKIKNKFTEMFLQKNFPREKLGNLCEFIKDGTHQTPTYTEDKKNGYKFLSSKDVTTEKINWDNVKYIPEELHKILYSSVAPRRGDILLAKNGTIGFAAIVDTDEIFDIYVSLALLRFKSEINIFYAWVAINSEETRKSFKEKIIGMGVPNLHLKEIKQTTIPVPPKEIQEKFAEFVEEVEGEKKSAQELKKILSAEREELIKKYFK